MQKEVLETIREMKRNFKEIAAPYDIVPSVGQHHVLVRLVRHQNKVNKPKVSKGIQDLLVSDGKGGFVEKSKAEHNPDIIIAPVVLILRSEVEGKEEGDFHMVPFADVRGMSPNPDYIEAHKSLDAGQVIRDTSRPKEIPNLRLKWNQYLFVHPLNAGDPTLEDLYTFRLPKFIVQDKLTVKD